MKVVITGGAGFIGRSVVERLVARNDDVVALVRDTDKAAHLKRPNVALLTSDLSSRAQLAAQMSGAEAVIHSAGSYRIGIKPSERDAMWAANVGATERVLDAAIAMGAQRIVYVSTANVLGNTKGELPDESYERDLEQGFLSWYDETKYRAHQAAVERQQRGAPIVIVMPGQVYGPNDHTAASAQLESAYRGVLRYLVFPSTGLTWVHVDDLADGIVAALDKGKVGESYLLTGEPFRMSESMTIAARVGGHRAPRLSLPTGLLRLVAPLNDGLGGLPGFPANMRETISAAEDVTYWAGHEKATAELGFSPRPLEKGVADTWGPQRG